MLKLLRLKLLGFSILILTIFPACDSSKHGPSKTTTQRTNKITRQEESKTSSDTTQRRKESYSDLTINGSGSLRGKSYSRLTINGSGTLTNIDVTEKLIVNGSMSASESNFQALAANGSINLYKTTVNGLSEINGRLNAESCIFNRIIVNSKRTTLSDSQTKTIHVRRPQEPVIELNNTKVDGDIIFDGGDGKVFLNGNSEITGKIVGGTLN